jgi:hypothetical protein
MEYCSLDDAFAPIGGGPANPGCKGNKAGDVARKEERKKAKRCKGPPLTFLEGSGDAPVTDPDRPALIRLPETPPLNSQTGLIQHAPVDAPPREPFTDMSPEPQAEMLASFLSQQAPSDLVNAYDHLPVAGSIPKPNQQQKSKLPAYFGANYDEDCVIDGFANFTNVIGDDPGYRLSPDFTSAFAGKGVEKASGTDVLPIPSVKNVWKPLTPSGASTAFFDRLPSPGGEIPIGQTSSMLNKEEMFRKLDSIYARLDDLESRRSENAQTETLLFIMSGIFVLFSMDLLVKRTGNVRILNG